MQWLVAFGAGFVSTLVFHQGLIGFLFLAGIAPSAPFNMEPVPPLGIPQVLSLAFWGGVWGWPLWWLIRRWRAMRYWLAAVLAGAVAPTAVAMLVVFPIKGLEVSGTLVAGGLLVNGAWGLGVALILWAWSRGQSGHAGA